MKRLLPATLTVALAALVLVGARGGPDAPGKEARLSPAERQLAKASDAFAQGRIEEARAILDALPAARVPRQRDDDAAYLRAVLIEDGNAHVAGLEGYLRSFPKGRHRREATLALARTRYARGEYAEAENLLSVFSPGVEKDFIGRQALILRGLAQLARGDAGGALQFLRSAQPDLVGSREEESYYFAVSQAALRASKPAEASEALRHLLARHAKGDYAPQALYALGTSLETVGRAGDAAGVFRQVMVRYPNTYEATRVRDRGIRLGAAPVSPLTLGGGFAVQLGAFSRRDLAEALARDLKLAGVEDVSVKHGSETPPIYRVRAGAFATREEARATGERIRRERGYSFTVVPR